MNRLKYFIEGVRHMKTRGTVAPTSRFTSEQMLKHIDFENAKVILELGAGDGGITKHILQRMEPDAILICFEINHDLCKDLYELSDHRLKIINDSAEYIDKYLLKYQVSEVDFIVSGIPFVMLPNELGDRILEKAHNHLRKGGRFIQFHYSLIPKKRYKQIFNKVRIEFEVRNIPPAWVFICS